MIFVISKMWYTDECIEVFNLLMITSWPGKPTYIEEDTNDICGNLRYRVLVKLYRTEGPVIAIVWRIINGMV
jgi:hypothetical protein